MKKYLCMAMAAAMAMGLAACGGSAASDTKTTEKATEAAGEQNEAATDAAEAAPAGDADAAYTTIKEGVLMVGTEIGYPPMEYFDTDGATPIGFDMELAQALADEMGLTLEIVDTAWDGIFAGVETGKYDVILSSVSWTEGRNEEHNLSKTYVANAPVLVVPKGSDIKDIADTDGKKVAVQMETTADYQMQKQQAAGVNCDLRQYEKVINCFDEIKAGRVDAVCTDSVVAAYYLGEDIDSYETVWTADEKEPICMCLAKGNDALQAAMEEALDALRANGKLGEISVKYFGSEDPVNNL